MSAIILRNQGKGTMHGILVEQLIPIAAGQIWAISGSKSRLAGNQKAGGGIIIKTGPQEFIVAGKALDVFFSILPRFNACWNRAVMRAFSSVKNGFP